jgi:hypothetical protein
MKHTATDKLGSHWQTPVAGRNQQQAKTDCSKNGEQTIMAEVTSVPQNSIFITPELYICFY